MPLIFFFRTTIQLIASGGVLGCATAMFCLLNPDDEVLLPNPSWPNYHMQARLAHARPVCYTLMPQNDYLPDFNELESLISSRTKLLLVNSPSNPTGQVFSSSVMAK